MPTTLTLLDHTPAAVTIQLDTTVQVTSLIRVDGRGTAAVRTPAGTFPLTGSATIIDHEGSLIPGDQITYLARNAAGTLAYLNAPQQWWTGQLWLDVPTAPDLSLDLAGLGIVLFDLSATYDSAGTVHQVIGRADPVTVLGPLRLPAGILEFVCPNLPAARTLVRALSAQAVLGLRQSDLSTVDGYFTVDAVTLAPADERTWNTDTERLERRWRVSVTYTGAAAPSGDAGSGTAAAAWTYDALAASTARADEVPVEFGTYAHLATGPGS